jgi:hypothetical protein
MALVPSMQPRRVTRTVADRAWRAEAADPGAAALTRVNACAAADDALMQAAAHAAACAHPSNLN